MAGRLRCVVLLGVLVVPACGGSHGTACPSRGYGVVTVDEGAKTGCDVARGQRLDVRFQWNGSAVRLQAIRAECDRLGGGDLTGRKTRGVLTCENVDH